MGHETYTTSFRAHEIEMVVRNWPGLKENGRLGVIFYMEA